MPMKQDASKYQAGEPPPAAAVPEGVVVSPDTRRDNRLPPGQQRTRKWPVLHYGRVPVLDLATWTLQVTGLVAEPRTLSWEQYRALPRITVFSDFHCVTRWSRLGNAWEGVSAAEIIARAKVLPEARHVILHGYDDGWTTNVPLADFCAEDVLVADTHDGEPISADHGGPARLIVPRLYAWKSAKWLRAIEFSAEDKPGYWERGGYHNYGDPWFEQRYNW